MNVKYYRVVPEYAYGDDRDEKRASQAALRASLGLTADDDGVVIVGPEAALELAIRGYIGRYTNIIDHIIPLPTNDSGNPQAEALSALVERLVDKLASAPGRMNERVQAEQPSNALMEVTETMLLEDCCTDNLQSYLSDGWRILAIQPQPDQRRPDYIMGRPTRPAIPKTAARG